MKDYETEKTFRKIDKFGIQLLVGFVTTILLLVGLNTAFAEPIWRQKPVQCGSLDTLIKVITAAGEKALIGALTDLRNPGEQQSSLTPIYIFVNTDTGTFTIVEYHLSGEDVCVIGYGTGVDFNVQHLFEKKTES